MRNLLRMLTRQSTPRQRSFVETFEMEGIRGKVVKTDSNSLSNHVELFINDVMVKKTQLTRDLDGTPSFDIGVYDIWRFAKRTDQVSVRFEGRPLEMPGGNSYAHPFRNGKEDLDGLAKRFEAGQTFDDAGKIMRLPKDQDFTWQEGRASAKSWSSPKS